MEPYSGQYKKNLIFRKQMSEKHPSSMVAEQNHKDICQKPNAYFTSNKEEKMEINWTNLTKRLHFHHLTSPSMDRKKRKIKTGLEKIPLKNIYMAEKGHSWNTIHLLSNDRDIWKRTVGGLCSMVSKDKFTSDYHLRKKKNNSRPLANSLKGMVTILAEYFHRFFFHFECLQCSTKLFEMVS